MEGAGPIEKREGNISNTIIPRGAYEEVEPRFCAMFSDRIMSDMDIEDMEACFLDQCTLR